ncbi:hypothetical protein V492_08490 [Pseudogymnoascus sp. VKM F-4246]|nr:hypothetical protein V492_08490 [Pseudogymnoascus sp. VKM F-4246]
MLHVWGAIFDSDATLQRALDYDVELCTARVRVQCVKSTGADETHCYGAAGADDGGEGGSVGFDGVPAQAGGDAYGGVGKGEDMV